MAKYPPSARTERRGISYIAAKCDELGHIWRETPNSDVGFDGEIELVTAEAATAQIIKVQVRTGASYIRNERPDRFDYYSDANELEYWFGANNPVLLLIFDPRTNTAFWLDIKNYLRIHPEILTERPHKITFLKEQRSKPLMTTALELLFGANYEEFTGDYIQHVIQRFSKLTIYSINSDSPLAVDLERVFIRLKAERSATNPIKIGGHHRPRLVDIAEPAVYRPDAGEVVYVADQGDFYGARKFSFVPMFDADRVTISAALAQNLNTVIIGSPGAGKTTLLKYLALTFARNRMEEQLGISEPLLPLFITLRDFSRFLDNTAYRGELLDIGPNLLPEFIASHLESVAPQLKIPSEFFIHHLESSKCILLLDGLDEVAEPLKRARVAEAIDCFSRQYKGNRFIVTSRPRGYEGEARQRLSVLYTDWTIQDFDDDDMEQFTRNWYEAVTRDRIGDNAEANTEARSKADDLLRAIKADGRVAALAHNPLLLSVLAMVHQRGVGLPQRRAELYDECTDLLLGYWDQTKGGEAARELAQYGALDRNEKRTLLEPIALWFHERGQENLEADKTELHQKIADQFRETFVDGSPVARKRAELFLRVIDERAGLLVEREMNVYSFAHLTFQEYLAARSIADSENYIELTLQRLHDDWWREVILLEIGHLSDVRHFGRRARKLTSQLIRSVRLAGSPLESVLRRDLFFAARAIADIGPLGVDDDLRQDIFKEVIELWQSTPYEAQRREAAYVLGYALPTPEGLRIRKTIFSFLNHTDPEKIASAMEAVAQIGAPLLDEDVTRRFLELSYHAAPLIRRTAAECLEKVKTASSTRAVTERMLALTEDSSSVVRVTAATQLVALGKSGMRAEIVDRLFDLSADEDHGVRDVALRSLARISQTRWREQIERRVLDFTADAKPQVRVSGALALGQIVRSRPLRELVERLLILITDTDKDVSSIAFHSFKEIAGTPARQAVINKLVELSVPEDAPTRKAAQYVLLNLQVQPFSVESTVPGDIAKRHSDKVRLMNQMRTEEPWKRFLRLSADPNPEVRLNAISLIHCSGYDEPKSATSSFFRVFETLMGKTLSPELERSVTARLVELLSDSEATVRLTAAVAYRQRLSFPYDTTALNILSDFWMDQAVSSEEIVLGGRPWKICDLSYDEIKTLAKLLPGTEENGQSPVSK